MPQSNLVELASGQVQEIIIKAIEKATQKEVFPKAELPDFAVEIPADVSHGDFATNVAMVGARNYRMAPPKIAQSILENIDLEGTYFTKVEMAGPGFINFFLSDQWFADVVFAIRELGDKWGQTDYGKGKKVMVEFVSANPTGPMHLGNARGGVIGDSLAAVLKATGHDAYREFYLNDAGNQIERFGQSLEARYIQIFKGEDAVEFPEDGYHGDDIKDRAKQYADKFGDKLLELDSNERRQQLVNFALPLNIENMKETLEKYHIFYDKWFQESSL